EVYARERVRFDLVGVENLRHFGDLNQWLASACHGIVRLDFVVFRVVLSPGAGCGPCCPSATCRKARPCRLRAIRLQLESNSPKPARLSREREWHRVRPDRA